MISSTSANAKPNIRWRTARACNRMQSRASDRSVCSRRRSHARAQARLRSLTLLDGLLASHPSLGQCQLAARNRKLGYRVPAACHLHNAPQGGAEQQVSGGARATGGAHAAGRPRHLSQGSRAADQAKRPALHPLREGPALAHRSELRRLLPHHQGLLLALLPRCVLVRRRSQAVEQVHVFVLEFLHRRVLGRCARYDLPTAAGHRVPVLLLALRTLPASHELPSAILKKDEAGEGRRLGRVGSAQRRTRTVGHESRHLLRTRGAGACRPVCARVRHLVCQRCKSSLRANSDATAPRRRNPQQSRDVFRIRHAAHASCPRPKCSLCFPADTLPGPSGQCRER